MKAAQANMEGQLMDLPKFGKGAGLHRVRKLSEELLQSAWWQEVERINIVGSNGKGSVAAIISAILGELGMRCGRFISPHLFDFKERISIDGLNISEEDLEALGKRFLEKRAAYLEEFPEDTVGAFEGITCLALEYFRQEKAEVLVLEAGLGGRYDPTSVFSGQIAALTSLDLEHTNLLGESLEAIAFDKMDIVDRGATLVVGRLEAELMSRLQKLADQKGIHLLGIDENCELRSLRFGEGKMWMDFEVDGVDFGEIESPLVGEHQADNILVAISAVLQWRKQKRPRISSGDLVAASRLALASLQWPGRLQVVHSEPTVTIDVGHTPQAVQALVHAMKRVKQKPVLLITGVSLDKNIEDILRGLYPIADAIVCTRAYHKGATSEEVLGILRRQNPKGIPLYEYERIELAVQFGLEYAIEHEMEILVAGGLFLAVEAWACLQGKSPENLRFF